MPILSQKRCPPSAKPRLPLALVLARGWAPLLLFLTACQTPHSWPTLTLSDPGWKVWNGQAIWRPTRSMPELTGDLVLAVNTNGIAFIQFSKTIPFAVARLEGNYWKIEFPPDHRTYSGHRPLPRHFAMLQLPALLNGGAVRRPWLKEGDAAQWQLQNPRTGETFRGYLTPQ